jgi:hypothetical protein
MKKALGWSDKDILANTEFLRLEAAQLWELNMITQMGPDYKNQLLQQAQAGAMPEGGDMGGPPMGGGGIPPSFGGGEAAIGGEEPSAIPPNAGNAPEAPIVGEEPQA